MFMLFRCKAVDLGKWAKTAWDCGKTQTNFIFMLFGPGGHDHGPQKALFFWTHEVAGPLRSDAGVGIGMLRENPVLSVIYC